MHWKKGQGATEYLVLLAVVLVIALVSIALLGFFPGTASDTSLSESQIYWKSAAPIAIVETGGGYVLATAPNASMAYLGLRNNGNYPIRITKVLGAGKQVTGSYNQNASWQNISLSMAPGETGCFGTFLGILAGNIPRQPCSQNEINFEPAEDAQGWPSLPALSTGCDANGKGFITINSFGFEYNVTIEDETLTKRFIGTKPLVIKCVGICNTGSNGLCYTT